MITEGHRTISKVGERVLKDALLRNNPGRSMRLTAFYLGNWLTDVGQVVDPVAYTRAADSAGEFVTNVERIFDQLRADAPSWFRAVAQDVLDAVHHELNAACQNVRDCVDALLRKGCSSELGQAFRQLFHSVGYFKFVLDRHGRPLRMDEASYEAIFERFFTQYYPHEHLDRPARDGTLATGLSQEPRSPGLQVLDSQGDLYTYLRDDIELLSGLLTRLDHGPESWAAKTFHPCDVSFRDHQGVEHPISDSDVSWNRHLAELGHILHGVEDFFAHSNFVELASVLIPEQYRRWSRWEHGEVIARRLKRWVPGHVEEGDNWRRLAAETHVVTGSFDFMDTLISLGHALEKVLERPTRTVGQDLDRALEFDYLRLVHDTLSFVSDPREVWRRNDPEAQAASDDTLNSAVVWLRQKVGGDLALLGGDNPDLNKITTKLRDHGALRHAPDTIKDDFVEVIKSLGAVVGGVGLGMTVFHAIKSIHTFLEGPMEWLEGWLNDSVYRYLKAKGEVYLRGLFYRSLGSMRIGSHSLIAKDSGPEVFHSAAMKCAEAVHRYVVLALSRHERYATSAWTHPSEPSSPACTSLIVNNWVDWLELLEYFLCHPFMQSRSQIATMTVLTHRVHVTRGRGSGSTSPDSLESLASEYGVRWEEIADLNFPVAGLSGAEKHHRINAVLTARGLGVPVSDGNQAFRPGVELLIPRQPTEVEIWREPNQTSLWWSDILVKQMRPADANLRHHLRYIDQQEQASRVARAARLRTQLEEAYK